jgi:hypothetical protein
LEAGVLEGIVQQLAGGGAQDLEGEQLHGGVAQMMQQAPNEHGVSAISEALGALGAGGFGQSVMQGAQGASPQARSGLAGMLMDAISQGGGSPQGVLSQLGIGGGGSSMGASELGQLASYAAENHGGALAGIMGNRLGSGGGSGELMQVLGNPMVRQVGMGLAKRFL